MFDYHNTSWEIEAGGPRLAILPMAAIEQHGPHLPAATDLILMETIARRVAEALAGPVFLLPVFPYGSSLSQAGVAGALWLTADTLLSVVRDVVESLYAHGIERVVVLNNHGLASGSTTVPNGNFVVKTAVRQLNYDHPEQSVLWVQPFAAAGAALRETFGGARQEVHAGAVETSLMLHLRADLVGELADGHVPPVGPEFLDFLSFADLCPNGVWGHPGAASAEKGARALADAIEGTVAYISTSFDQLDQAKERGHTRDGVIHTAPRRHSEP